jgi:hypothetical protein
MRRYLLAVTVTAISACTYTMDLPSPDRAYSQCSFKVIDERPNPEYLYAIASEGAYRISLTPTLQNAIRSSVCEQLNEPTKSVLYIDGFECLVQGFFETKFIANIRGRLELEGKEQNVRVSKVHTTSNGHVPKGCEDAVSPLIENLANEILEKLGSTNQ